GTIEKSLYAKKQYELLLEQTRMREELQGNESGSLAATDNMQKIVELAESPSTLYKTASAERKRELLKTMLSNLTVSGKNVEITLAIPFRIISERQKILNGGANRGTCRTWEVVMEQLLEHFTTATTSTR